MNIENTNLNLKLEEQSRLRLDFEHKINSLISINRQFAMDKKLFSDRIDQLETHNKELKS